MVPILKAPTAAIHKAPGAGLACLLPPPGLRQLLGQALALVLSSVPTEQQTAPVKMISGAPRNLFAPVGACFLFADDLRMRMCEL